MNLIYKFYSLFYSYFAGYLEKNEYSSELTSYASVFTLSARFVYFFREQKNMSFILYIYEYFKQNKILFQIYKNN